MIPVCVAQKYIRSDRPFGEITGHHTVAQSSNDGSGINNHYPVLRSKSQLNARGISTVLHPEGSRTRYRPPAPQNLIFMRLIVRLVSGRSLPFQFPPARPHVWSKAAAIQCQWH
jgi:hypothetical protein